jgi:hypothetical protein
MNKSAECYRCTNLLGVCEFVCVCVMFKHKYNIYSHYLFNEVMWMEVEDVITSDNEDYTVKFGHGLF